MPKIPPPPARFSPASPNSTRRPARRLTWVGDTRHQPGNLTARANRRPLTTGDYRRLMAAPAGR